jgi:hypothetical protein
MRTRNHKVQFWINDDEESRLCTYAQKTRMSKSAYLRKLINGYQPKEAPPLEYHQMMRELRAVGNNLNQLAHLAHVTGNIDSAAYEQNVSEVARLTARLAQAFLPTRCGD